MGNATAVTDQTFKLEVLQSEVPVLVDFWAPWCGPCRAVAPALEEIASEYAGKLKVVKMDVDESPEIPGQLGVQAIPTLMLFKGGEQVWRQTGALPKPMILSKIQGLL